VERFGKISRIYRAVQKKKSNLGIRYHSTHMDPKPWEELISSATHFIIDKLEGAIKKLGREIEQVVRHSDLHPKPSQTGKAIARAHGEAIFKESNLANPVKAELIGDEIFWVETKQNGSWNEN